MTEKFEKIIQVTAPYDKRNPDQKKNYGIGSLTLRFILKGEKGATQFIYFTSQHQKHVADELFHRNRESGTYNSFRGMGADIGYHSYKPQYEDHKPMNGICDILGTTCYYDGSSLQAEEFEEEFLRDGEKAVWKMLQDRYNTWLDPLSAKTKGPDRAFVLTPLQRQRRLKMCLFHKWSKWEQYEEYQPARQITKRWGLCAAIEKRQRKTCEKCGRVKDEIINLMVLG